LLGASRKETDRSPSDASGSPAQRYEGAVNTLRDEGFAAVRQIADADGVVYVEGIKKS
jgi:hypothetical protein